ncbi:DJ-1/PfpI family protein [Ekhidna sp.]|uniref:DJ-1/PfpI family protein n=1 Tax=Ekhidna sp. TaxID=2608089 RepID=UPI003299D319
MKKVISIFFLLSFSMAFTQNPESTYICPPCGSDCDKLEHTASGVCTHCNMVLIRKDLSKTIAFYLQDGVEILDFAGPMEVFSYAGYNVFTVSKNKNPIKSQGILSIVPDYSLEEVPKADILAFFGGNASEAFNDKDVIKWIVDQKEIQHYFSVCTGAFVLAEAGILDGNTATTFHNALDGLEKNYPKINVKRDVRFVDNGSVITTAGISAGIDGALHLVAKLQGLNAAKRTAFYMEYDNWVPGDGLILSMEKPYETRISKEDLMNFVGWYEYKDGSQFELKLDDSTNDLYAKINSINYPIFYETDDIFSDINSEPLFFHRNERQEIIGYSFEKNGRMFKRISD